MATFSKNVNKDTLTNQVSSVVPHIRYQVNPWKGRVYLTPNPCAADYWTSYLIIFQVASQQIDRPAIQHAAAPSSCISLPPWFNWLRLSCLTYKSIFGSHGPRDRLTSYHILHVPSLLIPRTRAICFRTTSILLLERYHAGILATLHAAWDSSLQTDDGERCTSGRL